MPDIIKVDPMYATAEGEQYRRLRALWASVLMRAVDDYWSAARKQHHGPRHKKDAMASYSWFEEEGGRFEWICEQLDLNPNKVRWKVQFGWKSSAARQLDQVLN